MQELYDLIEDKIKEAGYPGEIDGEEFYGDICDEVDEQDNGTFMFIIKKSELVSYQGCMRLQIPRKPACLLRNGPRTVSRTV